MKDSITHSNLISSYSANSRQRMTPITINSQISDIIRQYYAQTNVLPGTLNLLNGQTFDGDKKIFPAPYNAVQAQILLNDRGSQWTKGTLPNDSEGFIAEVRFNSFRSGLAGLYHWPFQGISTQMQLAITDPETGQLIPDSLKAINVELEPDVTFPSDMDLDDIYISDRTANLWLNTDIILSKLPSVDWQWSDASSKFKASTSITLSGWSKPYENLALLQVTVVFNPVVHPFAESGVLILFLPNTECPDNTVMATCQVTVHTRE